MQKIAKEIILASQSSFRRRLLESAGVPFQCVIARINEYSINKSSAKETAMERAKAKALDVAARYPQHIVIGADQILEIDGSMVNKVKTKEEAANQLRQFSGKSHELVNGLCLAYASDREQAAAIIYEDVVSAHMTMRKLSDELIQNYLEHSFEWQNAVGCYQYESLGVHFFDKVQGDYSEIIGLPLLSLFRGLRGLGIDFLISKKGPWNINF